MTSSNLEGELANAISAALEDAAIPYGLTVSRTVMIPGPNPWDPEEESTTHYTGRGFADEYDNSYRTGGLIEQGDIRVIVVADTIAIEPAAGDKVTVRGVTYNVVSVSADPALATWSLQARA